MARDRTLTDEEAKRVAAAMRAIMESRKLNQTTAQEVFRVSQNTIGTVTKERGRAGYGLARKVAAVLGMETDDLLAGRTTAAVEMRFRELLGWAKAVEDAREMRPFRDVPEYAFDVVGSWRGPVLAPVDPFLIGTLAKAWWEATPPDERSDAHVAHVQEKLAVNPRRDDRASEKGRGGAHPARPPRDRKE